MLIFLRGEQNFSKTVLFKNFSGCGLYCGFIPDISNKGSRMQKKLVEQHYVGVYFRRGRLIWGKKLSESTS